MSNFMKIRPVGAELFDADARVDTTKLTVALRNTANAPKHPSISSGQNTWSPSTSQHTDVKVSIREHKNVKLPIFTSA
jgi:hypothetical protein